MYCGDERDREIQDLSITPTITEEKERIMGKRGKTFEENGEVFIECVNVKLNIKKNVEMY